MAARLDAACEVLVCCLAGLVVVGGIVYAAARCAA